MKGLGGTVKKERSKEMSAVKRDIVADAYADMVGETREDVLVVEQGTADSVKCRDSAYRSSSCSTRATTASNPAISSTSR